MDKDCGKLECKPYSADTWPSEVLETKRPQKRTCGSAYKVRKHENGVIPAACFVTQRLYPRHVGNLPTLVAEILNDYSDSKTPYMIAEKTEENIGQS